MLLQFYFNILKAQQSRAKYLASHTVTDDVTDEEDTTSTTRIGADGDGSVGDASDAEDTSNNNRDGENKEEDKNEDTTTKKEETKPEVKVEPEKENGKLLQRIFHKFVSRILSCFLYMRKSC